MNIFKPNPHWYISPWFVCIIIVLIGACVVVNRQQPPKLSPEEKYNISPQDPPWVGLYDLPIGTYKVIGVEEVGLVTHDKKRRVIVYYLRHPEGKSVTFRVRSIEAVTRETMFKEGDKWKVPSEGKLTKL